MLQILSRIELRKYYDDTESLKVKCCFLEENIFNFGSLWKVLSNEKQPYNFPSLGTFLRKEWLGCFADHSYQCTSFPCKYWYQTHRMKKTWEFWNDVYDFLNSRGNIKLVAIIHILCPAVVCLHGRLVKFVCKPNYYLQWDWDRVLSLIRLDGY